MKTVGSKEIGLFSLRIASKTQAVKHFKNSRIWKFGVLVSLNDLNRA